MGIIWVLNYAKAGGTIWINARIKKQQIKLAMKGSE
jgi:hypothetical protein